MHSGVVDRLNERVGGVAMQATVCGRHQAFE